jgi:hypothetical protein
MKKRMVSRNLATTLVVVMLMAIIAAPALASPATATRTLPSSVESGDTFDVTIETSDCGAFGQVVETLPDGFTYISCTPSDIGVEEIGNRVKFTFLDSASFTYRVEAPTVDTTITYTFHGIVKDENKNEHPIQDSLITVTIGVPPPETYTLTMAVDGNGSTTPSVGSHTYDAGSAVNISAMADSGWRFDHWSGNVANPSSLSTTVTMDSNKIVTAHFTQVSGTRALPTSVASRAEFDVAIEVSGCGNFGQVVETLPDGFAYVGSSLPANQVEQVGNTVKFTFLGDSASFTYRVKAPRVAAATTYTFHGRVLDENRISYPIEDDDIVVNAFEVSGTRTLLSSVASGAEFDVNIEASGCGTFGQVAETLPSGFAYVSSSLPESQVEQIGNMVKFTFLEDSASFTYRVEAATVNTTTNYTFQGVVEDEDRISYPIEDDEITVIRFDTGDLTNVELVGADPTVTSISIDSYPTEDLTNIPSDLDPQSAYVVDSEGSGSFTLRFTNIANASNIVVYKVVDSTWAEIPTTAITVIDATTIEVTMEVGDPIFVFGSPPAPLAPTPPPIGGEGYFPNIAGLLAPWLALALAIIAGIVITRKRHKAQS